MPEINQLPTTSALQSDDLLPVYSSANGDARKASVNTLSQFVADQLNELTVTPSDATPQPPTTTGAAGVAIPYSRADHAHPSDAPLAANATPASPTPSGAVGTSARYARQDHSHPSDAPTASSATPAAPTVGGTAGVSTSFSRGDHAHPSDAPLPSDITPLGASGSGAAGSGATFSRYDHVHPGLTIKDEGVNLTTAPTSIDFTGTGVTATNVGGAVTVNVPGGTGSVTNVSVASANGFAGTVANPTTTPDITLSTSVSGILKGNGTAISAATMGTDYSPPITGKDEGTTLTTAITSINFTGAGVTATNSGNDITVDIPGGGGSGTVTSVSVVSANGLAGSVANATTTPAITLSTSVTGMLKGNGTAISAATSGTDYSAGTSALATGILKSTTTTGALSIAVAGDFPTLNQNTTGTAANVTGTVAVPNGGTGATTLGAKGILFGNGTSAVGVTGAGTAGQVLTSNGPGVDPTFQTTAGGGGALTKIASINPSGGTTNVNFLSDFSGTYNKYLIEYNNLTPTAANALILRVATGGSANTSAVYSYSNVVGNSTTVTGFGGSSSSSVQVTNSVSSTGNGVSGFIIIQNANDSSVGKHVNGSCEYQANSGGIDGVSNHGLFDATTILTGFQMFFAGTTFQGKGNVTLFGFQI